MTDTGPQFGPATGFVEGTFVKTALGMRPIERLQPGETLEFHDGSRAALIGLHQHTVTVADFATQQHLRPYEIPALSMGDTVPRRPLQVSGDIHLLAQGRMISRVSGSDTGLLIPVHSMEGFKGITQIQPTKDVTFYHLILEQHRVIHVEGLTTSTMFVTEDTQIDGLAAHTTPVVQFATFDQATKLMDKLTSKDRALITDDAPSEEKEENSE